MNLEIKNLNELNILIELRQKDKEAYTNYLTAMRAVIIDLACGVNEANKEIQAIIEIQA